MLLGKRKKSDELPQLAVALESFVNDPGRQKTSFDVLNDDCLHHLYKYLGNPLDVAHASEASTHLCEFASKNVYHKYSRINFFAHCPHAQTERKVDEALNYLLRHFGQHVTHCSLNARRLKSRWNASVKHIIAVLQNCPNLEQIRLQHFDLSSDDIKSLDSVKLQASEIQWISNRVDFVGDLRFWNNWTNLRSLTIKGMFSNVINLDSLQHLDKLSLANCHIQNLSGVLQSNRDTLKSLSLVSCFSKDFDQYDGLIELVPNLERLMIDRLEPHTMTRLQELPKLKHLLLHDSEIYFPEESIPTLNFEHFTTLDELDLMSCNLDQVRAAAQVSSLKRLSIRKTKGYIFRSGMFDEILSRLPNLQRLVLSGINGWSTTDTVNLLNINHTLEELVVFVGQPQKQTVQRLVDCLKQQPGRPTVTLIQIYLAEHNVEMNDTEREVLQENSHMLRLYSKKAWFNNEHMEDENDFVPTPNYWHLDGDDFVDAGHGYALR